MHPTVTVADDLSGAVECAWALAGGGPPIAVRITDAAPHGDEGSVTDMDTRSLPPARHAEVLDAMLSPARGIRFVKIDSALRGGVGTSISVAAAHGAVMVAPALPRLGRVTRDGAVYVDGRPLGAEEVPSDGEAAAVPSVVDAARQTGRHRHLGVADLRGPSARDLIAHAIRDRLVLTVDAETDDDLRILVRHIPSSAEVTLLGSAGLAAALAHGRHPGSPDEHAPAVEGPVLFVVGSRAPAARTQLALLASRIPSVIASPGAEPVGALREALASAGSAVLSTPESPSDRPTSVAAALAGIAASVNPSTLVLVGGQTARAVCERLRITRLEPRRELDYGTILCAADGGRSVIVRPGSFGAPSALLDLSTRLSETPTDAERRL